MRLRSSPTLTRLRKSKLANRNRDVQIFGELREFLPDASRNRDSVAAALLVGTPFRIAGDQHFVEPRRRARTLDRLAHLLHASLKFVHGKKTGGVDREEKMTDSHGTILDS